MIKGILYFVSIVIFIIAIVYFGVWIKKKVSYSFFYESAVEQTVKKMVKPECLK